MSGGAMGKIPPHAQRFIWEQNGGTGWGQNPKRNPRYNRYN